MKSLVLLLGAATILILTAGAEAKLTCQERGTSPDGIVLAGLPSRPVAGHTYRLRVTLADPGPNPTPYLGAQYCGEHAEKVLPSTDGWFREEAENPGTFLTDLCFSRPGRWALSFMDLDGTFQDFGIHRVAGSEAQVTHASARAIKPRRAVGSAALPNLVWLAVGGACLASGAGLCLANRRRRPG